MKIIAEHHQTEAFDTVGSRNFAPISPAALRQKLALELGDAGLPLPALKELLANAKKLAIAVDSPYFMNQLFAGISPEARLAEELIVATKATMATYEAAPLFALVEGEVIRALAELIGWDTATAEGIGVPGGSAANFMAVHCARHRLLPEVKSVGMSGLPKAALFISAEAHYSWTKAAAVLGLGMDSVITIEVNAAGQMESADLAVQIAAARREGRLPLLVAATAGTTVYGAFDPLGPISDVCRREGIWLHVDGAFGGAALFSAATRPLLAEIENVDSLTFDAHKLLGASLTCSLFLTRHVKSLRSANDVSGGDYLFHTDDDGSSTDRGKMSWQCGRRADAFVFWVLWKHHGACGLGASVDRLMELRDEFLYWVKGQQRLILIRTPQFLTVCIQVLPPDGEGDNSDWSRRVREAMRRDNQAMVNFSTTPQGIAFLRCVFAHRDLTMQHLKDIFTGALNVR